MSVNYLINTSASMALIATLCFVPTGYAEVPFMFNPGQPARAAEVNENFSALDERVTDLEQSSVAERTFNYVIVDADTGIQVGVDGGSTDWGYALGPDRRVIFKLEMQDGSIGAEISRIEPPSLPEVATDTKVTNLYHGSFNGTYSCTDLTAIGWYSRWFEFNAIRDEWSSPLGIPEQEFTQTVNRQFGVMPSGDPVLAEVSQETSVSWASDYSGIPCLDPARYDPTTGQWGCPPSVVQVECVIEVVASPHEQGFTPENWSLRVPADAAFSAVAPYAWAITVFAPSQEAANSALVLCNDATGGRCEARVTQGSYAYTTRMATPHAVSYTSVESTSAVAPIGHVPGNRGEPRRFKGEFR